MSKPTLSFIDLGLYDYGLALQKQKELWQKRINNKIGDTLIFVEHPPVFTIGKHGKIENLHLTEISLKQKNVQLYHIERGGDITFHGPGQLVGYPIIKLNQPLTGVRQFIHNIERILCKTLKSFDINAEVNHPYIGVWVEDKKIVSIGVAVKNRVTFHGFALNVSTDLSYFNLINPCGIKDIKMVSMEQILQKKIPLELIKNILRSEFIKMFV